MVLQERSSFGLQWREEGATDPACNWDLIAPGTMDVTTQIAVIASVGLVAYRRDPYDALMVEHIGTCAPKGTLWVPFNDLLPGQTFESCAQRICEKFLGFTPSHSLRHYTMLDTALITWKHSVRTDLPFQSLMCFVAYEMRPEDIAALHVNHTADGKPAPRNAFGAHQWVSVAQAKPRESLETAAVLNMLARRLT